MSVALLLHKSHDLDPLLGWASLIARARQEDLLILQPVQVEGEPRVVELGPEADASESLLAAAIEKNLLDDFDWRQPEEKGVRNDSQVPDEKSRRQVRVKELHRPDAAVAVLDEVTAAQVHLLILPRHHALRSTSPEYELERQLFRDAPCETVQLRLAGGAAEACRSLLVPSGPGHHTTTALQLAAGLAEVTDGKVTALYVEPNVDEVAEQVGQRIVQQVVDRAIGSAQDRFTARVIVANDVVHGIESVREEGFDLLLLGVRYHGVVHRLLFPSISERLITSAEGPAVAVVRPAIPLTSRLIRWGELALESGVPQLDRTRRVALVERVQTSSQWDFDFIALICLSTLIATLGLMLNSAAVVIGAMLVAPLMTPLLGAGLSLVQGNAVLLSNAVNAVFRGFLLAVLIAFLVGLLTPDLALTTEMEARGSPGVFDLLVAFTSGIAAAYAIGRPNLLSALPGVAIAASLVPPISTCGLGLVLGRYNLAIGAGLFFLTNIIAIVLGAACSLFAVGIRGTHAHGTFASWAWRVSLALVMLTIGLGIYEALPSQDLPADVRTLIAERLGASDAEVVEITVDKYREPVQIDLLIELPRAPEPRLATDLLEILRRHYRPQVELQLRSLLVSRVATSP